MGCDPRIKSGLDWLFSLEKEAIVLEDDCIPDLTFVEYCEELLEEYREDDRVSYIAGSNQIRQYPIEDTSYIFTYGAWTLGWRLGQERGKNKRISYSISQMPKRKYGT